MKDSTGDNKTQGAEVHGNQKEGGRGEGGLRKGTVSTKDQNLLMQESSSRI